MYLYLFHTARFHGSLSSVFCVCFICNKLPHVTTYIRYNYFLSLIYLSSLQLQTIHYLIICSLHPSLFLINILQYTPLLSFFLLYTCYSFFNQLSTSFKYYKSFFLFFNILLTSFYFSF